MTDDQQPTPEYRVEIENDIEMTESEDTQELLQQLVLGQERQNDLLEELLEQLVANQRQRSSEITQWKQANPELSLKCRRAAEALSKIQTEFLNNLAEEVNHNLEGYIEGDFLLNEFVDRYGPRLILIIGTLIFGIGFFVFSIVQSITSYFIAFILIALGSSLGGFATLMVAIVSWFDQHRAKAIAWSQFGFSIGGLCVPLVVLGLEFFGWRAMALYSGIAVLALGLPMVALIRHRPEDYGEVPDGISHGNDSKATAEESKTFTPQISLSWRQAIREPSFWLISIGHGLSLLTVSSMLAHLIPHLTNGLGYTPVQAGVAFALMTGVQMGGLLLGGILGDRYEKSFICVLCMVGHCVGLLMVTYASSPIWILGFTVFHGFAWGIRGPLMVALRADYFGPKSFGTIMGISSLIVMIGMTVGPIVCGVLYDLYGNYELAFTIMALCSLTGGLCFWFAKPPAILQANPTQ